MSEAGLRPAKARRETDDATARRRMRDRYEQQRAWAKQHLPDLPVAYVVGSLQALGALSDAEVTPQDVRRRTEAMLNERVPDWRKRHKRYAK